MISLLIVIGRLRFPATLRRIPKFHGLFPLDGLVSLMEPGLRLLAEPVPSFPPGRFSRHPDGIPLKDFFFFPRRRGDQILRGDQTVKEPHAACHDGAPKQPLNKRM
jgi:hypothetical protein